MATGGVALPDAQAVLVVVCVLAGGAMGSAHVLAGLCLAALGLILAWRREAGLRAELRRWKVDVQRARGLLSVVPDTAARFDLAGRFLEVHSPPGAVTSMSPEQLLGRSLAEVVPRDEAPRLLEALSRADVTRRPQSLRYTSALPDGSHTYEVRMAPGAPGEVVALQQDITARLQADQEARWMAVLVAQMSSAVVVTDLELTILSWSPGAERMTGWTAQEAVGRSIPDVLGPGPVEPPLSSRLAQVLREGRGTWEALRQRRDGTVFVASTEVTLLRDAEGRPERLLNVSRDVTAERRAQDALQEARALNEAILASLDEGVVVRSSGGALLAANAAAERILGLSRAQLEAAEAKPPGWRATQADGSTELVATAEREQLLRGEPISPRVGQLRRGDGTTRWVSFRAASLAAPESDGRRILMTVADVTDAHEASRRAVDEARLQVLDARSSDIELLVRLADRAIVHANDRAVAAYGYTRDELLALHKADLRGDPGHPMLDLAAVGDAAEGVRVQNVHRRKDGSTFPVELSARRFQVDGEAYLHLLVRDLTEARRADAERRLLAKLVETMEDGVVVINEAFEITHFTPSAERLLGWSTREMLGRNLRELPIDFFRGDGEEIRRKGDRGQPVHAQARMQRKDGAWVDFDFQVTPLQDDAGHLAGRLLVARDVGPALAAERALREREETLRSIFDAMAEGVVFQDAAGRIIRCNPAAERILGMTQAQLEGLTSLDPRWRSVREDGSPFPGEEHPVRVSLRTGRPVRGVLMGVDATGQGTRWLSVSSEPLRRAPGEAPYAAVATFADVTQLRLGQEALAESEARYRSLFEHSRSHVSVFEVVRSPEGRVVDWILRASNAQSRQFFGEAYAEAVGKRVTELVGEAAARPYIERSDAVLAGDVRTEQVHLEAQGRDYLATLFPIDARTLANAALDITDRVRAEEALKATLATNQQLVAELKQALEQVDSLKELLPICVYCHKIREDEGYWSKLDSYFLKHGGPRFSHGICPECAAKHFPDGGEER